MRITSIDTFRHWVDWCNWLVVRVTTDEGIVGWGEGSLHGAMDGVEATIREMAAVLIGQDPSGPEQHWQRLYNAWRWRGGATFMTALAAIDTALWDIEGKRLGVPVYRLLGGAQRTQIRAYASHWLTGVRTPDKAFEGAKEARRRGFSAFKFIPVTFEGLRANEHAELTRAAELMAAAREGAGPDCDIFIECSEFLSPRTLLRLEDALAPYRGETGRFRIDGADLRLPPKTAVSLALAIHELATNAVKYGALSVDGGFVRIAWRVKPTAGERGGRLHFEWREQGGPPVAAPSRRGFGTRLIERSLAAEFEGEVAIDFRAEGVVCTVDAPLPDVAR